MEEWCAIQGSNLQQSANSLENSQAPSQGASQNLGSASNLELAQVVAAWPKLSAPLRAAILAIAGSVTTESEAKP
jgi:hypothetical protein